MQENEIAEVAAILARWNPLGLEASGRARVGGKRQDGRHDAVLDGPIEAFQFALGRRG